MEEEEKKRTYLNTKKQQKEKDSNTDENKKKFVITAREMETLEELKTQLAQQTMYLQKFKMMSATQQRSNNFSFGNQGSLDPPPH